MTRDQRKFISLNKEKKGSVTFGNDIPTKIIGIGTINLGNEKTKETNVSLVKGSKHNLLSLNQTYDQGHTLTFNSKNCEIRKKS